MAWAVKVAWADRAAAWVIWGAWAVVWADKAEVRGAVARETAKAKKTRTAVRDALVEVVERVTVSPDL